MNYQGTWIILLLINIETINIYGQQQNTELMHLEKKNYNVKRDLYLY